MKKLVVVLFLLPLSFNFCLGQDIEGFAGMSVQTFEDYADYNTSGLALRLKYNHYTEGKGYFIYSHFKGESILNFDTLLGYGLRTTGPWFFEAGGGLFYSFLFGAGYGILLGTGANINNEWFISLPLIVRVGGLSFIQLAPMIGLRF